MYTLNSHWILRYVQIFFCACCFFFLFISLHSGEKDLRKRWSELMGWLIFCLPDCSTNIADSNNIHFCSKMFSFIFMYDIKMSRDNVYDCALFLILLLHRIECAESFSSYIQNRFNLKGCKCIYVVYWLENQRKYRKASGKV